MRYLDKRIGRVGPSGPAARFLRLAIWLAALLATVVPAAAQEVLRVGHFPNVTHVQALVARNFERAGRPWFEERLGAGVKSSGTPTMPGRAPWRRSSPTRWT
jgi:hypothetical protein